MKRYNIFPIGPSTNSSFNLLEEHEIDLIFTEIEINAGKCESHEFSEVIYSNVDANTIDVPNWGALVGLLENNNNVKQISSNTVQRNRINSHELNTGSITHPPLNHLSHDPTKSSTFQNYANPLLNTPRLEESNGLRRFNESDGNVAYKRKIVRRNTKKEQVKKPACQVLRWTSALAEGGLKCDGRKKFHHLSTEDLWSIWKQEQAQLKSISDTSSLSDKSKQISTPSRESFSGETLTSVSEETCGSLYNVSKEKSSGDSLVSDSDNNRLKRKFGSDLTKIKSWPGSS